MLWRKSFHLSKLCKQKAEAEFMLSAIFHLSRPREVMIVRVSVNCLFLFYFFLQGWLWRYPFARVRILASNFCSDMKCLLLGYPDDTVLLNATGGDLQAVVAHRDDCVCAWDRGGKCKMLMRLSNDRKPYLIFPGEEYDGWLDLYTRVLPFHLGLRKRMMLPPTTS